MGRGGGGERGFVQEKGAEEHAEEQAEEYAEKVLTDAQAVHGYHV